MIAIYKKLGRRYAEIGVYDDESRFYPHGVHLVVSGPGSTLTRYNVDPQYAGVLAAAKLAEDAMVNAIIDAQVPVPTEELTGVRLKAWEAYKAVIADHTPVTAMCNSAVTIAQAGIKALIEATKKQQVKIKTFDYTTAADLVVGKPVETETLKHFVSDARHFYDESIVAKSQMAIMKNEISALEAEIEILKKNLMSDS